MLIEYMPATQRTRLDRSENLGLDKVTTLHDLGAGVGVGGLAVGLEQLGHVKLGGLEDLGLADVDVVQGVDALEKGLATGFRTTATPESMSATPAHLAGLLNLAADRLGDKLLDELLEVGALGLAAHDLDHLGADLSDLGRLGVGGLLDLVEGALGEADGEETKDVAVGGADVDRGLDQGLPLADDGSELVGGEVHAVERGEAVLALERDQRGSAITTTTTTTTTSSGTDCLLRTASPPYTAPIPPSQPFRLRLQTHRDVLHLQLDLPEALLGVVVEVGERHLHNTALQRVIGVL
jgi:hypothetical protein